MYAHPAGAVHVLKGVNFTLEKGSMTAILGRSGTGKSTFLHVVGTLDSPTEGAVFFKDQDLFKQPDSYLATFRNRHLGFAFQFHYLLPEFTALENVLMPAWIAGSRTEDAMPRAQQLLDLLHLGQRQHHRPNELSGGEQQRVSLARALILQPDVLMTDEVTGNLDFHTGEEVLEYLKTLNERFGVSVLSVTHHRDLAERFYHRTVEMEDGILRELS
jgi:lipoprotein-releasing system ATP-binding protein